MYEGEFKAGVWHGQGRLEFVNGDVYDGDFVEGIYNGLGTLTSSDGQIYNGSFLDGKRTAGPLRLRRGRHPHRYVEGRELDKASALRVPDDSQTKWSAANAVPIQCSGRDHC